MMMVAAGDGVKKCRPHFFDTFFGSKNVNSYIKGIQSRKVSHVSFCSDLFFLVVRCDFLKITLLPTCFFVNVISIA